MTNLAYKMFVGGFALGLFISLRLVGDCYTPIRFMPILSGIIDDTDHGEFVYAVDGGDIYIVKYETEVVVCCDYLH